MQISGSRMFQAEGVTFTELENGCMLVVFEEWQGGQLWWCGGVWVFLFVFSNNSYILRRPSIGNGEMKNSEENIGMTATEVSLHLNPYTQSYNLGVRSFTSPGE